MMTLLEATSHLIDQIKTWCPTEDRKTKCALRRMEMRLSVLQLRAAKALRRRRHKGYADLVLLCPDCKACGEHFLFGDFAKTAELRHSDGSIIRFDCPVCSHPAVILDSVPGTEKGKRCERYLVLEPRARVIHPSKLDPDAVFAVEGLTEPDGKSMGDTDSLKTEN